MNWLINIIDKIIQHLYIHLLGYMWVQNLIILNRAKNYEIISITANEYRLSTDKKYVLFENIILSY